MPITLELISDPRAAGGVPTLAPRWVSWGITRCEPYTSTGTLHTRGWNLSESGVLAPPSEAASVGRVRGQLYPAAEHRTELLSRLILARDRKSTRLTSSHIP